MFLGKNQWYFLGANRFPDKNLQKNDSCNLLSDCWLEVHSTHLKCLSVLLSCFLTSRGIVAKTKMKPKEKLSVEKLPQMFDRMNCIGLRIRQRLRTISCFWFFFCYIFGRFQRPLFSHFQNHLVELSICVLALISKMCKNLYKFCLKSPTFLPQFLQ